MRTQQALPKPQQTSAVAFDEDLERRCFPHKFRKIGDPFGYLDSIGIEPILEFIYKGNLLIDVAQATNVPLIRIRRWVEEKGHFSQVEDAETQSADGYLAFARHALKTAPNDFELRRAKELMRHAQFMAENKNKHVYGGGVGKQKNAPVHYQFIIGNAEDAPEVVEKVLEGESRRISEETAANNTGTAPPTVDLQELFGPVPDYLQTPEEPTIKPVLTHRRPVTPTAKQPDVGPFYDDPTDQENTELPEFYGDET